MPRPARVTWRNFVTGDAIEYVHNFYDWQGEADPAEGWTLAAVAYASGVGRCEGCGRTPIKRLFLLLFHNAAGQRVRERMLGYECACESVEQSVADEGLRLLRAHRQRARETRQQQQREQREQRYVTHAEVARSMEAAAEVPEIVGFTFEQTEAPTTPEHYAHEDDRANIVNGTFEVTDPSSGGRELFQIYTVQRGPLRGQRIIRRRDSSVWRGFATLLRDEPYTAHLWRRYAEDAEAVRVHDLVVDAIPQCHFASQYNYRYDDQGRMIQLVDRRCRRCNAALRSGFLCNACMTRTGALDPPSGGRYASSRGQADPMSAFRDEAERVIGRHPGAEGTPRPVRARARHRSIERDEAGMLLSELGTGEVL